MTEERHRYRCTLELPNSTDWYSRPSPPFCLQYKVQSTSQRSRLIPLHPTQTRTKISPSNTQHGPSRQDH